jgi:hypothetical protein
LGDTSSAGNAFKKTSRNEIMNDPTPSTRIREILDGLRYIGALTKQLPVQPLLAALLDSFVLGVIPMLLTALYSLVRVASHCNWQTPRLRGDDSKSAAHVDQLIKHWEIS